MTHDPITASQLYWLRDGTLWSVRTADLLPVGHDPRLDVTIFFTKHAIGRALLRLRAQSQLTSLDADPEELIRQVIVEILRENLVGITREGALTTVRPARPGLTANDPSADYLNSGATLEECWIVEAVRPDPFDVIASLVVRRCLVERGIAGIEAVDDQAHVAVTIVERGDLWREVFQGVPVPVGHATHLIGAGETFDPDKHLTYRRNPDDPIFRRRGSN